LRIDARQMLGGGQSTEPGADDDNTPARLGAIRYCGHPRFLRLRGGVVSGPVAG
jgi:hypothetical protein